MPLIIARLLVLLLIATIIFVVSLPEAHQHRHSRVKEHTAHTLLPPITDC